MNSDREARANPPVIHVVGHKDTGKTFVVERLIEMLTAKGYRIGSIKRSSHDRILDQPGTDSDRHRRAGAVVAGYHAQSSVSAFSETGSPQEGMDKLLDWMRDVDLVIVEGGKHLDGLKIEVFIYGDYEKPVSDGRHCLVIVTDKFDKWSAPVVKPSDLTPLVAMIEDRLQLKKSQNPLDRNHPEP